MDISMPIMDGYTAAREIRKIESELGVPKDEQAFIVALTAHSGDKFTKQSLENGMDKFMGKPVQKKSVEKLIKNL